MDFTLLPRNFIGMLLSKKITNSREYFLTDFMVSGLDLGLFSKDTLQPRTSVYPHVYHRLFSRRALEHDW